VPPILSDLFSDKLPASQTVRCSRLPAIQFADVVCDCTDLFLKRCLDGTRRHSSARSVIGLSMLAIRLTSPGEVLYRQVRLGRSPAPFVTEAPLHGRGRRCAVGALQELNEVSGPVFKMRTTARDGGGSLPAPLEHRRDAAAVERRAGDMSLMSRALLPTGVTYDSWPPADLRAPGLTCLAIAVGGRQFADGRPRRLYSITDLGSTAPRAASPSCAATGRPEAAASPAKTPGLLGAPGGAARGQLREHLSFAFADARLRSRSCHLGGLATRLPSDFTKFAYAS
jgi:hypothetical protein